MPPSVDQQREADAGFFEDWRPYGSVNRGAAYINPMPKLGWYAVSVCGYPARDIVSRLPGATWRPKTRYHVDQGEWWIPAASWRPLLAAAPELLRLSAAHLQARRDHDDAARRRLAAQDEATRSGRHRRSWIAR